MEGAPFDWTPDIRLEVFGSFAQGTALLSSDLDVRMFFEQFAVLDRERQLKYLRGVEAAPGDRFEVVELVPAKLPLLKLRFDQALDVDLTMGAEMTGGAEADHAVHQLLGVAADDAASRLLRLVKVFAKMNGFVDAFNGYLNSISWASIVIVFLQIEHILPPLHNLRRGTLDMQLHPAGDMGPLLLRFFRFIERCGSQAHGLSV